MPDRSENWFSIVTWHCSCSADADAIDGIKSVAAIAATAPMVCALFGFLIVFPFLRFGSYDDCSRGGLGLSNICCIYFLAAVVTYVCPWI